MNAIQITTLPDKKICDFIDQKIRSDTVEEYVRQNIERRLVLELGFSVEQIAVEYKIKLGSSSKRADLVLFHPGEPHDQDHVWMIIECKKDTVDPKNKADGVEQLKSYMAACPNAEWGMWSNGKFKAVYRKVRTDRGFVYDEPNDIPSVVGDLTEIDRPKRENLKKAVEDNLLFSFRTCHNHIYVTDGMQKQPAFFELLKVIFCKISDERNIPHALEFFATASEKASHDGRLSVKNRINAIFAHVKKRYPAIFDPGDEIKLQPRSLAYVVGELQRYSFLDTNIDVKGKAYEELVGANLRGDRGEFFTPRNVQRMAINMLDLKLNERIIDPACGTGGFLVIAMNKTIEELLAKAGDTLRTNAHRDAFNDRVREIARQNFFGIDINPDLVKATKMNMVMNNDGAGNMFRQDALLHPHQWEADFKRQFAKAVGIRADDLRQPSSLGLFDVIATNPPFGSKLPIKDRETLSQYELGHVWTKNKSGGWDRTDDVVGSAPPEILFIERCWQFLKPGGRMAIVLPDAILGAPGLGYVRQWIIAHCRLVASVDLHPDTFQPRNGTQTSVLVLQRKTQDDYEREAKQRGISNYAIFMAQVHAIGHDKRGNNLFRRNEEGEEIWVPEDVRKTLVLERSANGDPSIRPLRRQRIIDDDTPEIARRFLTWKHESVLGW